MTQGDDDDDDDDGHDDNSDGLDDDHTGCVFRVLDSSIRSRAFIEFRLGYAHGRSATGS